MPRAIDLLRANWRVLASGAAITVVSLIGAALIGLPPPFLLALLVAMGVVTWGLYRWRTRATEPRPLATPTRLIASSAAMAVVVVLAAAQAVPYGRAHTNPTITGEPQWATAETRALMVRACWGCHSNEVEWPWYSNVAPISWAVTKHVDDGRRAVNYQEWDRPQDEADETVEEVKKGSMPPAYYTFAGLHGDADLSAEEMSALIRGLANTPGMTE